MATAAGLVSAGVATKFVLDVRDAEREVSAHDTQWTDDIIATHRRGRRAERRMAWAFGVSAALVAGGVATYALGYRARQRAYAHARRLRVTTAMGPSRLQFAAVVPF